MTFPHTDNGKTFLVRVYSVIYSSVTLCSDFTCGTSCNLCQWEYASACCFYGIINMMYIKLQILMVLSVLKKTRLLLSFPKVCIILSRNNNLTFLFSQGPQTWSACLHFRWNLWNRNVEFYFSGCGRVWLLEHIWRQHHWSTEGRRYTTPLKTTPQQTWPRSDLKPGIFCSGQPKIFPSTQVSRDAVCIYSPETEFVVCR